MSHPLLRAAANVAFWIGTLAVLVYMAIATFFAVAQLKAP